MCATHRFLTFPHMHYMMAQAHTQSKYKDPELLNLQNLPPPFQTPVGTPQWVRYPARRPAAYSYQNGKELQLNDVIVAIVPPFTRRR